jgi:amidase
MARSVSDAAYVLSIIAGKDANDNYTAAQPWDSPPDYTQALNFSSLRGARIGVPSNVLSSGQVYQPVLDAFEDAISVLKRAGATVVDNANFSAYQEFIADNNETVGKGSIVLDADFVSGLANYFSELTVNPNNIKSLADVSNFTHSFKLEEYPQRDTFQFDQSLSLGYKNTDPRFWDAYQFTSYLGGEGGVTGALKAYDLDALILPTDYAYPIPAFAGLPVVTVPLGFYPSNFTVVKDKNWGVVEVGPNIP